MNEALDKIILNRWKAVTDATNTFWHRWKNEYLSNLQLCQKWLMPERKYKVGDLVIIWTESVPNECWPMGIVVETKGDPDGLVRM